MKKSELKKVHKCAEKIITTELNGLVMNYPFLARAAYAFKLQETEDFTLGTNGEKIFVNSRKLMEQYLKDYESVKKMILHCILHCTYRQLFNLDGRGAEYWDMACDVFIEKIISLMGVAGESFNNRCLTAGINPRSVKSVNAVYKILYKHKDANDINFEAIKDLFKADSHDYWWLSEENPNAPCKEELSKKWQQIADSSEASIQVSGKLRGDGTNNIVESLQNIKGEQKRYSDFLRQFGTLEEQMKIDVDSFDYVYYSYGLSLYDNVPLIEPLEYKVDRSIVSFVVAIDTSGSCDTEMLKKFLSKTLDILGDTVVSNGALQIHVIQCDSKVQRDDVIHSKAEAAEFMKEFKVVGRGGTDFRPVFKYVEELRENGSLTGLQGLLYFTDGYGIFPSTPTEYKTAFVFLEPDENVTVPPWAMKVYIDSVADL